MGTIARRVGQAVVRITGDALVVLPSAPDAMTYVMEAGRTEEVVLDLTLPDTLGGLSALPGAPLPAAQLSPDGRGWHLPAHGVAVATR